MYQTRKQLDQERILTRTSRKECKQVSYRSTKIQVDSPNLDFPLLESLFGVHGGGGAFVTQDASMSCKRKSWKHLQLKQNKCWSKTNFKRLQVYCFIPANPFFFAIAVFFWLQIDIEDLDPIPIPIQKGPHYFPTATTGHKKVTLACRCFPVLLCSCKDLLVSP